jgi:hypothetical protein
LALSKRQEDEKEPTLEKEVLAQQFVVGF